MYSKTSLSLNEKIKIIDRWTNIFKCGEPHINNAIKNEKTIKEKLLKGSYKIIKL